MHVFKARAKSKIKHICVYFSFAFDHYAYASESATHLPWLLYHSQKQPISPPPQQQLNDHHAFSFSPITLQMLPHLSLYLQLQDLQPEGSNPLDRNPFFHASNGFYINSSEVVLRHIVCRISPSGTLDSPHHHLSYIRAGPRKNIFFDPSTTRAAVVTCGVGDSVLR
ncbi:hypothetical protein V6N13_139188 [Hibiscus sabdariffa]|uniref:Uncharacterized protein n=1 Tax=Hibiscus sabdariffa TaxID=183260 RepID=A0ABR2PL17_9ROSI